MECCTISSNHGKTRGSMYEPSIQLLKDISKISKNSIEYYMNNIHKTTIEYLYPIILKKIKIENSQVVVKD
jgi:hypothetical protein